MAAEKGVETNVTKPVNEAVQEYRVIEDGAFAHYLQEREIENHYASNVNQRRRVMSDIKTAKQLQDEEDKKANILTLDEQEQLNYMDEKLAEAEQERLVVKHLQDERDRKERELKDNDFALLMMEKERRREQRRAIQDRELAERLNGMEVSPGDRERLRQMTDEELARRLQEEEELKMKRTDEKKKNTKIVVEMQDEELARYIHEREMHEAEMMQMQHKGRKKGHKSRRGEPPNYYPHEEDPHLTPLRPNDMPSSSRSQRDGTPRRPPHPRSRPEENLPRGEAPPGYYPSHEDPRTSHPGNKSSHASRGSRAPEQYRREDETVPKSMEANMPDRRHTTKDHRPGAGSQDRAPRRINSEKPHRPPPPEHHSEDRGYARQSSEPRRHGHARDDRRHPPHSDVRRDVRSGHGRGEADIAYGEGFARLAEEEAQLREQEEQYRLRERKKKGDCKQQ